MGRATSQTTGDATAGFTLIELLVVISIIGVLAGLILPTLGRAKEAGRSTACLSNLRQIGIAIQLYVDDHHNRLPVIRDRLVETNGAPAAAAALDSIDVVLSNYLGNVQVLRCPSDLPRLFETTGSSYSWNNLLNGQAANDLSVLGLQFDPHQIPVVFDKEAFHEARGPRRGVNYLYADGHIKNLLAMEGVLKQ